MAIVVCLTYKSSHALRSNACCCRAESSVRADCNLIIFLLVCDSNFGLVFLGAGAVWIGSSMCFESDVSQLR